MMSSNPGSSTTSSSALPQRLGPAWRSGNQGRGFQPPAAVSSDHNGDTSTTTTTNNNNNTGSNGITKTKSSRSNSLLSDSSNDPPTSRTPTTSSNDNPSTTRNRSTPFSSRSDALRSGSVGTYPGRTKAGVGSGRSLAELASRAGTRGGDRVGGHGHHTHDRSHRHNSFEELGGGGTGGGGGRGGGGGERGGVMRGSSGPGALGRGGAVVSAGDHGKPVIRITREKLLSMRPRPQPGEEDVVPLVLRHLEGTPLLSEVKLDPVCWDTFDADAIWAQGAPTSRDRHSIGNHIPSSKTNSNGQPIKPFLSTTHRSSSNPRSGNSGTTLDNPVHNHHNNSQNPNANRTNDAGTWRRGVALPPPSEDNRGGNGNRRYEDAEHPEDLWDDPPGAATAANDFSAFGGSLDEQPISMSGSRSRGGSMGSDGFDLGMMSEAAQKFEEEFHGTSGGSTGGGDDVVLGVSVDPLRPLADAGTTIRSGSGDDVNVFEDFGAPELVQEVHAQPKKKEEVQAVKKGDEQTASSRLMHMIGVTSQSMQNDTDINHTSDARSVHEEDQEPSSGENAEAGTASTSMFSFSTSSVPRNPWGDPVLLPAAKSNTEAADELSTNSGLDLAARLKEVARENQTAEQQQLQQRQQQTAVEQEQQRRQMEEVEARRRQEEEEKRRIAMLVQQQAEQARQQEVAALRAAAAHQQQQAPPQPAPQQHTHNQLEVVLIERISTILEKNWGRSDLGPLLQTLHTEDSRVIPLLGTVDALRALIARHPRRIALAKDPTFHVDIAVLATTTAVWQQQQQQQQAAEELRRLQQEQQKMMEAQQEAAAARAKAESRAREAATESIVITNDPWYYADPQANVQGPFGGEEMRQWLEAGYFKGDLPISQNPEGTFRPLSSLFPDLTVAFKPAGPSEEEKARIAAEAEAALEAKAKADAIREMAEKEEALKAELEKAKTEAREAAEKERLANEARTADKIQKEQAEEANDPQLNVQTRVHNNAVTNKKQSDQLKILLGLGGSSVGNDNSADMISHKGIIVSGPPSPKVKEPQIQAPKSVPKASSDAQPQTKPVKTKSSKKTPSTVVTSQPEKVTAPAPAPASTHTPAPAWGGAGAGKIAGRKKSMSEIQKEEAKIAAEVAKQRGASNQTNSVAGGGGGGWANIAASGGTGAWSGTTVIPSPAPVPTPVPTSTGNSGSGFQQTRARQQISSTPGQQQVMNRSSTQKTMEEFGANGKMSPMLESWCKDQMRKLNGSEDLTLIAFCMTLSDPIEIKQYITAYLGSTPQVNNFATEFINRKNGNPRQEQWETTAKKGRKKKGGVSGNHK